MCEHHPGMVFKRCVNTTPGRGVQTVPGGQEGGRLGCFTGVVGVAGCDAFWLGTYLITINQTIRVMIKVN